MDACGHNISCLVSSGSDEKRELCELHGERQNLTLSLRLAVPKSREQLAQISKCTEGSAAICRPCVGNYIGLRR